MQFFILPRYSTIAALLLVLPLFLWPSCLAEETKGFKFSVTEIIIPGAKHSAKKLISFHKPLYLMVHRNQDAGTSTYFKTFADHRSKEHLEFNPAREIAFQYSGKILLATFRKTSLYTAGNQEFYWQFYTKDPYFRSIDSQFEFFLDHPLIFNTHPLNIRFGYVHRSNGLGLNILKTEHHKRSNYCLEKGWDRLYGSLKYDLQKCSFLLKLWHIFIPPESGITYLPDTAKYNRDIGNFLGYGKFTFRYQFSKSHFITVSKRLFDKSSCYGASLKSTWELNYFIPVLPAFQIIVKGFSGYGENMVTYDSQTFGAGIGIALCFD